jgi:hypothetical protein
MEMETLNPEMGEGVEELEVADQAEVIPSGEEESEVAEPTRTEQDAAFAQMRRQIESLQRERDEQSKRAKEFEDALGLFFDGDDKAGQANAYYNERPYEEYRQEQDTIAELTNLRESNASLQRQLVEQQADAQMSADLAEIQRVAPEVKSIGELGKAYLAFRFNSMGGNDAVTAFKMAQAYTQATTPKKPPVIGGVSTQAKPQSDFYSREEVEAMTPKEVSANYDAIRQSMTKW